MVKGNKERERKYERKEEVKTERKRKNQFGKTLELCKTSQTKNLPKNEKGDTTITSDA